MWSQWHLSAHLLVIAATCLTLVLVVCIWTQYKNKSPSAQVKRSHLLCTLSYPRPQSHRHRDHSATTINLWSLGSWWGVSGRWWNWLQRVLHHKLPWDCFGCWSIAASACILHAVLVFGALPCRILADAAMWLFKVVVAVLTTFTLTANIVCLSFFQAATSRSLSLGSGDTPVSERLTRGCTFPQWLVAPKGGNQLHCDWCLTRVYTFVIVLNIVNM